MGRALICQKSAILMQGSACPPHLGGGGLGRAATRESRNSSGGPGSPSRTRMRSSSSGSSGACQGTWEASRVSDSSSWAQRKRAGTRIGSIVSMSQGGSGGGGMSMMPSHIPWRRRKNSISSGRVRVPCTFMRPLQQGQRSGSSPQMRRMRFRQRARRLRALSAGGAGMVSGRSPSTLPCQDSNSMPRHLLE